MLAQAKLSKYKIKKIMEYFCVDVDATKTSVLLKFNRNTINRYFLLFREAIFWYQSQELHQLFGDIEVDESYFGAKRARGVPSKRGRGTSKQPVFGVFERGGRVYTEIIPNCQQKTLQGIIKGRIDKESVIHSDKWRGYNGLVDVGYNKHYRVNHSKNFATKGIHINGIESFWSFTKRRLTKFNGYKDNFHLHLKECEWRWDREPYTLQKDLAMILKKFQKK